MTGTRRLRQIQKQQIHCNNTDATREQLYRSIWNLKVPTYIVKYIIRKLYNDDESEYKYNILFSIAEAAETGYSLDVLMGRNTFATVTGLASQQIKETNKRFDGKEEHLPLAKFMRDEQRWLEHLGDPRLCTRDGKSTQATASVRCMSPLKSPSDEPAPQSPPESLSAPTETASPISPPGDPYYETPVFTPEYVDTPYTRAGTQSYTF